MRPEVLLALPAASLLVAELVVSVFMVLSVLWVPSVPTVPSGPMVVFSGAVGRMVVWGGMVVTVVGAVVGRGRGATVVICVVADVSMPLSLRQAVSIAAVRTKVSARIVNRFIMILL